MNKSLLTNLVAGAVSLGAFLAPPFTGRGILLQAGLFALSGALTNWLAIHMLFERVPGLYGSGIVTMRFQEFKAGIRALIMNNFFTQENFEKVAEAAIPHSIEPARILEKVDLDSVFDGFVETVKESSMGRMLGMVGGERVLQPLRTPFKREISRRLERILEKVDLAAIVEEQLRFDKLRPRIETMVDLRLEELTPQMVKAIIERMIRDHLGWLVVWGGVFGGLMGVAAAVIV